MVVASSRIATRMSGLWHTFEIGPCGQDDNHAPVARAEIDTSLSSQFVEALADPNQSIAIDRIVAPEGAPALVCFGGISGGLFGPPFEFLHLTEAFTAHRVFVRDLEQCWYQQGIRNLGTDVPGAADALDHVLNDLGATRRIFVGTSSGGFAAVLFGVLAGADEIVAFAPQASLKRVFRARHFDRRWAPMVKKARRNSIDPAHIDLVQLLRTSPGSTKVRVHYGTDSRLDTVCARRLGSSSRVSLTAHPGEHTFVRELRDSGSLEALLRSVLEPDVEEPDVEAMGQRGQQPE